MWARWEGTIRRSSPTRAFPVARMRFSPLGVKGSSVVPVWRPLRDHSVSPWRTMKTRGVGMVLEGGGDEGGWWSRDGVVNEQYARKCKNGLIGME